MITLEYAKKILFTLFKFNKLNKYSDSLNYYFIPLDSLHISKQKQRSVCFRFRISAESGRNT